MCGLGWVARVGRVCTWWAGAMVYMEGEYCTWAWPDTYSSLLVRPGLTLPLVSWLGLPGALLYWLGLPGVLYWLGLPGTCLPPGTPVWASRYTCLGPVKFRFDESRVLMNFAFRCISAYLRVFVSCRFAVRSVQSLFPAVLSVLRFYKFCQFTVSRRHGASIQSGLDLDVI